MTEPITLCFIIGVPLARKSITFICKEAFSIAGCQIEGMTTGKSYTQGFLRRLFPRGIACIWLASLKKWNRVLDWYEKRQFCSFNKNCIFPFTLNFWFNTIMLSWINTVGLWHNIHMLSWNTGKNHSFDLYLEIPDTCCQSVASIKSIKEKNILVFSYF